MGQTQFEIEVGVNMYSLSSNEKFSCRLMIIWSISLCMGDGSGRVLSLSERGAIPVLWLGVTEPVMVRLLTNSCRMLTDRSGWTIDNIGLCIKELQKDQMR
jgi:hypothetical protein